MLLKFKNRDRLFKCPPEELQQPEAFALSVRAKFWHSHIYPKKCILRGHFIWKWAGVGVTVDIKEASFIFTYIYIYHSGKRSIRIYNQISSSLSDGGSSHCNRLSIKTACLWKYSWLCVALQYWASRRGGSELMGWSWTTTIH